MSVQQGGNGTAVGQDPGHVRGRREAADQQRAVRVAGQLLFEVGQVDMPVGVFADDHDVGNRLAPRQLIGVMFVRPHEHDWTLRFRNLRGKTETLIQAGRDPQFQNPDQLIHRCRRPGSAEDDQVIIGAADGVPDDPAGVLAQPRRLQPGSRALGMGVRIARQDRVADEVLDEVQCPPRGGVVRVGDAARAERTVDQLALADDAPPDPLEQRRRRHFGRQKRRVLLGWLHRP